MRCAPSTKSVKRSLGPVDGPTGSYEVPSAGPAGPVWPEWLKYGPIEMITGVFAAAVAPFGRRTSACSVAFPALDGDWIQASLQSASGYATPAADAVDGSAARQTIAVTKAGIDRTDMFQHTPVPVMRAPPTSALTNVPGSLSL